MVNEQLPRVSVSFHTSSQKGGGVAHTVRVDEGATAAEADRIYNIAWALHCRSLDDEGLLAEAEREGLLAATVAAAEQRVREKRT